MASPSRAAMVSGGGESSDALLPGPVCQFSCGEPWLWGRQAGACGWRCSGLRPLWFWAFSHHFIGVFLRVFGPVVLTFCRVCGLRWHCGQGGKLGVLGVGAAWRAPRCHGWWCRSPAGCPRCCPAALGFPCRVCWCVLRCVWALLPVLGGPGVAVARRGAHRCC